MDEDRVVTFKNVAGYKDVKEELRPFIEFLKDPDRISKFGGKVPQCALLVGPPGVGKKLLARAVAGEAERPFSTSSVYEFIAFFGQEQEDDGETDDEETSDPKKPPLVLFFDNFDAIASVESGALSVGSLERVQIIYKFLAAVEVYVSKRCIVFASTSNPESIDPVFLAPGLFDKEVVIGLPKLGCREEILQIHTQNIPLSEKAVRRVARSTIGASGADLVAILNEAALEADRLGKEAVEDDILYWARDRFLCGPERKHQILIGEDRKITAYHEAGHVVVACRILGIDTIERVTIVPTDKNLGTTLRILPEDRHCSKKHILDYITFCFGGRAAEEISFGGDRFNTGCEYDTVDATESAWEIVCAYGMSSLVGPVSFVDRSARKGGKESYGVRDRSPDTQREIDQEINRINNNALKKARSILRKDKKILHAIAKALIEKETLDGEEVREIMDEHTEEKWKVLFMDIRDFF